MSSIALSLLLPNVIVSPAQTFGCDGTDIAVQSVSSTENRILYKFTWR